jgi:hypothetical protein
MVSDAVLIEWTVTAALMAVAFGLGWLAATRRSGQRPRR